MSDAKLDVSPLPWTVELVGRDTPNGVSILVDAEKRNVCKEDRLLRRDDAQFIVRCIAERNELIACLRLIAKQEFETTREFEACCKWTREVATKLLERIGA